jgi:hypothetical protein
LHKDHGVPLIAWRRFQVLSGRESGKKSYDIAFFNRILAVILHSGFTTSYYEDIRDRMLVFRYRLDAKAES